jgi:hypothetical protein
MQTPSSCLRKWLQDFSAAVRRQDFGAGKYFLTSRRIHSARPVFARKIWMNWLPASWQQVWPHIQDFEFEYGSARAVETRELATVLLGWRSPTLDQTGNPVDRLGRPTIVPKKFPAGWKALHTHFSISPHLKYDPVLWHTGPR